MHLYHTFELSIDLRDQSLDNNNLNATIANLLRNAAGRIESGHRIGGFHSPDAGYSYGGGFAFYGEVANRPKVPPQKEINQIIAAIGDGELTRENKNDWAMSNLEYATPSQFNVIFDDFIKTKEQADQDD